jgi:hypothetical protein
MKFVVIILFAIFLVSCELQTTQHKAYDESRELVPYPEGHQKDSFITGDTLAGSNTTGDINKHPAFNEPVDTLPQSLKTFIPAGYSAIHLSSGDANLDGLTDKILVLRKNTEEITSNYGEDKPDKRPLLLLLGQADETYRLAIRNDNAAYCIDCGGAFGDPFTGTTIKNGFFSIEHGIAGGLHWEHVITFKYDKTKNKWFLYKDHFISYKLNDSDNPDAEALVKETDQLKTVKDFGMVSFDTFNIYKDQ